MTEHVPFFEWIGRNLSAVVTISLAIATGVFFMVRQFKDGIDRQLLDVRTEVDMELKGYRHDMKNVWLKINESSLAIVALQTEQRTTAEQLREIKISTRDINLKLDAMADKIADVLVAIRHNGVK